jgi:hypothetical protein
MSNEYYAEQMEKWEPVEVEETDDVNEEKSDVRVG